MESLEDILKLVFSLVFGAIYLFGGQMFKGNKEDKKQRSENSRKADKDNQEPDEQEARQREIREAILRKIQQRRNKKTGSEPEPLFQEPLAQNQEQVNVNSESIEKMDSSPVNTAQPVQETAKTGGGFSWDVSENVYQSKIQKRLQQIEATKRQAEVLKKQLSQINVASEEGSQSEGSNQAHWFSGSVRSTLRNPRAARTAFIYGEILGKPIGLQRHLSGPEKLV